MRRYTSELLLLCLAIVCTTLTVGLAHRVRTSRAAFDDMRQAPPADALSAWRIVVYFQPSDCPSGMDWLQALNSEYQAGTSVQGFVLAEESDQRSVDKLIPRVGVRFPAVRISHNTALELMQALGYRSTPLAILITPEGQVRYVSRPKALIQEARRMRTITAATSKETLK